jgi:hypothetical protein
MGFRTVVMLSNDRSNEWENDPELGKRIAQKMNFTHDFNKQYGPRSADLGYGRVVQCTHADDDTLVRLSDYEGFHVVARDFRLWEKRLPVEETNLLMVREAADRLGYRLVRKSR